MRISPERIKELQKLLKEQTGREYTNEEAEEAGLAIMRFVIAKAQREKNKTEEREVASNLVELVDLLIEINKNQEERPVSEDDDPRMYLIDDNGTKILL